MSRPGSTLAYTRFELLRTARSRRFVAFSLGFPVALYLVLAVPHRNEHDLAGTGIGAPLYFMVALAAFGAINAVLAGGARIAAERSTGWTRQLRSTPLSAAAYLRTKLVAGYALALATVVALALEGTALGVRLSPTAWLELVGLLAVGLVPFAALGILMGHLLTVDSIGPALGGSAALFAFLGGVWGPLGDGTLRTIAQQLPSYWLVTACRTAVAGGGPGLHGTVVVLVWALVLTVAAAAAYLRSDATRE